MKILAIPTICILSALIISKAATELVPSACNNQNYTLVPTWMDNLKILNLSGNVLPYVQPNDFPPTLTSLEIVILSEIRLRVINNGSFDNLIHVTEFDVSKNLITQIYLDLFCNNVLLNRLNLSNNSLKKINASQCVLPSLEIMDISKCFLETVEDEVFENLPKLQWLNLEDNKLKALSFKIQSPQVIVDNNPWACDCTFWIINKIYVTDGHNLKCTDSERNLKFWNETEIPDKFCDDYFQNLSTKKVKKEKPEKEEDGTDLILNVYGYVFVGITILICLCCCCDNKSRLRKKFNPI